MSAEYTLHLGDCLEYMRGMEPGSVDAVVTDPPYPGLKGGLSVNSKGSGLAKVKIATDTVGDPWGASWNWIPEAWRVCRYGMMVFCSYASVDTLGSCLREAGADLQNLAVWYKRNSMPPVNNIPHLEAEYIWMAKKKPGIVWRDLRTLYDFPMLQAGALATERILGVGGRAAHPAQKPVRLMRELVGAGGINSVFDPFAGTGTTGVACMQLGRNFVGCEIDPGYYAIAEKRIREAAAQPPLFTDTPPAPREVQVNLFTQKEK